MALVRTPGHGARVEPDGGCALGSVADSDGEVVIDGRRAWLLGYSRREDAGVRGLDLGGAGVGDVVDLRADHVLTVVDGVVVGLVRRRRAGWPLPAHDDEPAGTHVHLVPVGDLARGGEFRARRRLGRAAVDGRRVLLVRAEAEPSCRST